MIIVYDKDHQIISCTFSTDDETRIIVFN